MAKKQVQREVILKDVRLSYPALYKKKAFDGDGDDGKPKFRATGLIDTSTPQGKKNDKIINRAIDEIIEEKWGKRPKKLKDDKLCYRDGNEKDPVPEGYEDHWYIVSSSDRRPQVRDKDKSPLAEDDGVIYAGCRVNMILNLWAQDNKYGVRINASLEAVQYKGKGDAFGAAPVDADAKFDDESDEEDEDEKPKRGKKRRDDDDDDDDKPRGKKRRGRDDDDDDDDDKSRRRRRNTRDDDDDD